MSFCGATVFMEPQGIWVPNQFLIVMNGAHPVIALCITSLAEPSSAPQLSVLTVVAAAFRCETLGSCWRALTG